MSTIAQTFLIYQGYGFGISVRNAPSSFIYGCSTNIDSHKLPELIDLWQPFLQYICENKKPQNQTNGMFV